MTLLVGKFWIRVILNLVVAKFLTLMILAGYCSNHLMKTEKNLKLNAGSTPLEHLLPNSRFWVDMCVAERTRDCMGLVLWHYKTFAKICQLTLCMRGG